MKMIKHVGLAAITLLAVMGMQATVSHVDAANAYYQTNQKIQTVKSSEVLQAGTVIPATLVTRINSDSMDSVIVAIVRQNVYDTVTGTNVLIPAGSKLIGEPYNFKQSRINISFARIIFPNGHSVEIPDFKASDGIGQNGLKDKYTTHSWLKVRSVLTGAVFAGVAGLADKRDRYADTGNNSNTSSTNNAMDNAIATLIEGVTDIAKEDAQNVKPTGVIREGYQFNVVLDSDIQIRPYNR